MEARISASRRLFAIFLAGMASAVWGSESPGQPVPRLGRQRQAARVSTEHFVVTAENAQLARKVALEAERYRKQLAQQWLGHELGAWRDKCPISVQLGLHAGGETSFAFMVDERGQGTPINWEMKIFGPADRLLDAVLPHEITHTIFATHFGRPLPRWADEGACTTVEHESERSKNHQMLIEFLNARPSRGIPFNRMFTMRNYPHDILPLYAQGYSLAKFLISQKGRRHFLDFVESGMNSESAGHELRAWNQATAQFYGYDSLSDLQVQWLQWVKAGSRIDSIAARTEPGDPVASLASTGTVVSAAPQSVLDTPTQPRSVEGSLAKGSLTSSHSESWYTRQMKQGDRRFATNRHSISTDSRPHPEIPEPENDMHSVSGGKETVWR